MIDNTKIPDSVFFPVSISPSYWKTSLPKISFRSIVEEIIVGAGTGDMTKAVYDTNNNNIVDAAESVPWAGITGIPSALTNAIFVGWDSADSSLQVMHNDGSGTCTKIALGASFPVNSTTAVYEFMMFAPPNGSSVYYRIVRLDTGATAEGEITTDLPASTTFLTRHEYMNNGGTAAAVVLETSRVYIETDY